MNNRTRMDIVEDVLFFYQNHDYNNLFEREIFQNKIKDDYLLFVKEGELNTLIQSTFKMVDSLLKSIKESGGCPEPFCTWISSMSFLDLISELATNNIKFCSTIKNKE